MAETSRSVTLSNNAVVNGLIDGGAWDGPAITYSFAAGDINANGIQDFAEGDWKAFYLEIIDNIESFARIDFEEVSEPGNINFKLVEGGGGESGVPAEGTTTVDSIVGINVDVAGSADAVKLGTFSLTWLHETGHALGLKHPHDVSLGPKLPGVDDPADKGTGHINSQIYTVMGYTSPFLGEDNPFTSEVDFDTPVNAQPGSFGAIDIAALQHLYGARAHNVGNNSYQFSDDVDFNRGYTTIWDTGGHDAITYVGESRSKIDLRAATLKAEIGGGGWVSTSEMLTGGFTIAKHVVIENATGSNADDILIGNKAANTLSGRDGDDTLTAGRGSDKLRGGLGADDLTGGAGADTFAFKTVDETTVDAAGRDTISDFSGNNGDRIDLSAIDANAAKSGNQAFDHIGTAAFTGKAGELRHVEQDGGTFVYGDTDGDRKADFAIHLDTASSLSAGDFVL